MNIFEELEKFGEGNIELSELSEDAIISLVKNVPIGKIKQIIKECIEQEVIAYEQQKHSEITLLPSLWLLVLKESGSIDKILELSNEKLRLLMTFVIQAEIEKKRLLTKCYDPNGTKVGFSTVNVKKIYQNSLRIKRTK